MLIFKVKIKQKLNSEPEITRKNEIFPGPENSSSSEVREKLFGVSKDYSAMSRMNFFSGNVGEHDLFGVELQSDNRDINQHFWFYKHLAHLKKDN